MEKPSKISASNTLQNFIRQESAGGVIMLIATALAIIMANTFLADTYKNIISFQIPFAFGDFDSVAFKVFVKDVLMVLFFFVIGMELKRETTIGVLAKREQIILPLIAAAFGMAVPAMIYSFANSDVLATQSGWAIPAATDIAFALCVLTIFGRMVPPAVKMFLLAIAIFDDLGAVIIIAFFYSSGVHFEFVLLALVLIGLMFYLNRSNISNIWVYLLNGLALVVTFHHAGIHTTVAGVITGFMIPLIDNKNPERAPLDKLMKLLNPWVTFLILPVFAFVSAGVSLIDFDMYMLLSPVTVGVTLGLFIGKQIGIFGITYAMVKMKFMEMPEGANWKYIYAVSVLCGIGFTMSLFVSQLAFTDPVFQEEAKLGILLGSLLSTILGAIVLRSKLFNKTI